MLQIGDKVIYNASVYVLALFYNDDDVLIINYNDNSVEKVVSIFELKKYNEKYEEVYKRLRTNEALEEELDQLKKAIKEIIKNLEASEEPFYKAVKQLKELTN